MLAAAAAGVVSACTPPEPRQRSAETVSTPGPSPSPSAAPTTDSSTVAPTVVPTSPPPAPAARSAVVARYQGARPTQFGLTVPGVINRLRTDGVALTFDACGGPGGAQYDQALIKTLRDLRTPATLFLNARWIKANPATFRDLAADPLFDIGNHGTRHLPLTVAGRSAYGIAGTRDAGEVYDEIAGNHDLLTRALGRPPAFFRSGTAHYDDVATKIVADLGEQVIGFDVNADSGARASLPQLTRAMAGVRPGSIVIAHMNRPEGATAKGMAATLPGLLAAGIRFTHLR